MTAHSAAPFRKAKRLEAIAVSEILKITAEAVALKKAGRPMLIFGTGEPDFDTPEHIKAAATAAMARGETKYTTLDGSPALKAAIRDKFARENGLDYGLDEITCGAGAKQVIHNAMMATLDPGDEVVIPTPFWTSYEDIVALAGGVARRVPCGIERGFKLSPEALEAAITPRTCWLMLNSPSNPTGAAYSAAEIAALGAVLERHKQVWVMADDIYEHIVYDGFSFATPAAVLPWLKERTLTINGVSKAYAMTGWRLGYGGGPKPLIRAIAEVQSQSTSCPSSISQAAVIAALGGPQDSVHAMVAGFARRRRLVLDAINAVPGLSLRPPEGAFYAFVDCSGVIGRTTPAGAVIGDDRDFCRYLMTGADVAVVPGVCFGLSPFFRISYAASDADLIEGMGRIGRAVAALG
ncbi:MAG: pyridoxal phosphate-dependent aminotransferase [Devosia sp.]